MFSLKTLITHTYTQSSKAVSGGKKKHGGGFIWVGQLAFSVMHERETGANISRGQTKTTQLLLLLTEAMLPYCGSRVD